MKRTVNTDALRQAIEQRGNLGKEKLALETGVVTVNSLDKMMSYKKAPLPIRMESLCRVLNLPIDVLFPIAEKRRRSA